MFCQYCGILGHDLKHCAAHFVAEKNGRVVDYQYGDFLRTTRGRPRASMGQNTGSKSNAEEVTNINPKQKNVQAE